MITVAFFNNKGGVGKTTLLFHVAWMMAELGVETVCADFDPQSNLTSMCLGDERLDEIWPEQGERRSIYGAMLPLINASGALAAPHALSIRPRLSLIPGDLALARSEDRLSVGWMQASAGDIAALRFTSAFGNAVGAIGREREARLALLDVGPNLGAITRAALIAADFIVVPLAPDLFSIQALRNLGPTLRDWRRQWAERAGKAPTTIDFPLPRGAMQPAGYVVMQFGLRDQKPVRAYERFLARIPAEFHRNVVEDADTVPPIADDPYHLASLKHYRSLAPLAMQANKPMFELRAADGVIGAHVDAVRACRADFRSLATALALRIGLQL
ncbi:MAG: ParA family protein [Xanthomonadales bacterium]|nr:ParA family protein [Xanthomonadales bacterium]